MGSGLDYVQYRAGSDISEEQLISRLFTDAPVDYTCRAQKKYLLSGDRENSAEYI